MTAAICLLVAVACAGSAQEPLSFATVGFYGIHLPVGDFAFLKFTYTSPEHKSRIPAFNRLLEQVAAAGQRAIVGLYTFDRVTHKRPIEEYVRNTDQLLAGLRRDLIYAACPSEENVTWNRGLQVLNALYECISGKWKLPCYQWLTVPDPPHGKLRADGWIFDAYGFPRERFRRHLAKFIVTGKPVVACVNATSPKARHAAEKVGPWEPGAPAEQQMRICREFNVPVFFYAVDPKFGSVHAWLREDDPLTARCRQWALEWIERAHQSRGQPPLPSAQLLDVRPMEVSGGEEGRFKVEYDFSSAAFLDYAGVEGLLEMRWDGIAEKLYIGRPRIRRFCRLRPMQTVTLLWHLTSPQAITSLRARCAGELAGGASVSVAVGEQSHRGAAAPTSPQAAEAERQPAAKGGLALPRPKPLRCAVARTPGQFDIQASTPAGWTGREIWVIVRASTGTTLDHITIECTINPPKARD